MTESQAIALASALAPCNPRWEAFHTGGQAWVVRFVREDGSIVVMDEDWAIEYASEAHWADGTETAVIKLDDFAD